MKQSFTGGKVPGAPEGSGDLLARPHQLQVYAYPKSVNAANADNIYTVLSSVPANTTGSSANTGTWFNSHQSATVVPPTFNPHWLLVNTIDYSELFSDALIRPCTTFESFMRLCQISVVDKKTLQPITGTVETPGAPPVAGPKFAFKFVLTFKQTMPLATDFTGQRGYTPSFADPSQSVSGAGPSVVPALIQPLRMTNST